MFGAEQGNQCGKLAFAPARKIGMAEQRRRVGPQAQGFGQRIARLGMALHQFFERRVQRRQRIVLAGDVPRDLAHRGGGRRQGEQ